MIIQLFPPVFVVFSRDVWQTMWHCAWAREKDSNKHFQTKAVYFPSESGVFVCKILCGDVAGKRHPLYKSYICIEPLTACCWWPWPTLSSTIFSIGKLLHTWNFEFRPCHIPPSVEFMSIYDKKNGRVRPVDPSEDNPLEFEIQYTQCVSPSVVFLFCIVLGKSQDLDVTAYTAHLQFHTNLL